MNLMVSGCKSRSAGDRASSGQSIEQNVSSPFVAAV